MPDTNHRPIIFLNFANEKNDRVQYLRNLGEEVQRLRNALEHEDTPYTVVSYPDITIEQLITSLRQCAHRIAIYHYGGHAGDYGLLLESAGGHTEVAYAGGLIKLLAQQRELHLVFLNGCSTQEQAQALIDAGIPVVVATTEEIDDEAAMQFAANFYQELINDATLQEAFARAEAEVEVKLGGANRGALYHIKPLTPTGPPWHLYYRDETAIQWRLADVVDDPCFGLPGLPQQELPVQPFLGLARFRRRHAEIFFGRGAEIRDLYERVLDPKASSIILLYGQSGVGKSSLLEAGVMPRLESSYVCHYVPREQQRGLTGSLAAALCGHASNKSIAQAWLEQEAEAKKPLLVILDQVEEAFTHLQAAQTPQSDELTRFIETLETLFPAAGQRPCGKLILGFRKEFLAEIEKRLSEKALSHAKVFVEHLNRRGVMEAVTGVTRGARLQSQYGLTVDKALPPLIADELLADPNSPIAPTLQMLLTKMWDKATVQNGSKPVFAQTLYLELRHSGILLDDFLEQQLQLLKASNTALFNSGLVLDLLFQHTTPWATAKQCTAAELAETYKNHPHNKLQGLVQQCKTLYLLTDPSEDQHLELASRLAHDALAPLLQERFNRSAAPGQRALRLLESHSGAEKYGEQGTLLNETDLKLVKQGMAGMRAWTTAEVKLVESSERDLEAKRKKAARQKLLLRSATLSVIVIALIYALSMGIAMLRDQNQANTQAETASQNSANLSLQALTKNPVASMVKAISALPAQSTPKPYVPDAEFALTQALRINQQLRYLPIANPPLAQEQVALGRTWLAVGSNALHLVTPELSQVVTLTASAEPIHKVEWASNGTRLLTYQDHQVDVWQDKQHVAGQPFTTTITCAEWQPGHEQVAVCSGNALYLWSYQAQGGKLQKVKTFTGPVASARWSPDGHWLAAWDTPTPKMNQTFGLWDDQQGRLLAQTVITYTARIDNSTWSTDNLHVVAASKSASRVSPVLYIWQVNRSPSFNRILLHAPVDGIKFIDVGNFITWGTKDVTRLWSIDGRPLRQFGIIEDAVQDVTFSPERTEFLTFLGDGSAYLWNVQSAARIAAFRGHSKHILGALWHKTQAGSYLATNSLDGTVRIWEMPTGKALMTLRGHTGGSVSLVGRADVFSPYWLDERRLLTAGADGSLRIWQVFDEQGLPLCEGVDASNVPNCYTFSRAFTNLSSELTSARWLNNQTFLMTDRAGTAQRCSLTTCDPPLANHASRQPSETLWSPDGQQVFTYTKGFDGQVVDYATGHAIATVAGPITTAFWLDTGLLISRDAGGAFLINPESGALLFELQGVTTTITAAQSHANGRLAIADQRGVIHLWDITQKQEIAWFVYGQPITDWQLIHTLQWSADGSDLLAIGSKVMLWHPETGQEATLFPDTGFPVLANLSPDGQLVAIAADRKFWVLNAENGEKNGREQDVHTEPIGGIQWITGARWPNQESNWLVGGLARLLIGEPWNPGPARRLLVTWSGDGTTRVWDWEHQLEIMRMTEPGITNWAIVSPNGFHLLTAGLPLTGRSGTVRVWQTWFQAPDALLATAYQQLSGTPAEIESQAFLNQPLLIAPGLVNIPLGRR